ncbi:MAG: hypothetical protein EOO73_04920 [Myxococcales bacterium]|nr:MAG: hypothetical protein EOO73_04920 [Myxococcales bacterium]
MPPPPSPAELLPEAPEPPAPAEPLTPAEPPEPAEPLTPAEPPESGEPAAPAPPSSGPSFASSAQAPNSAAVRAMRPRFRTYRGGSRRAMAGTSQIGPRLVYIKRHSSTAPAARAPLRPRLRRRRSAASTALRRLRAAALRVRRSRRAGEGRGAPLRWPRRPRT